MCLKFNAGKFEPSGYLSSLHDLWDTQVNNVGVLAMYIRRNENSFGSVYVRK